MSRGVNKVILIGNLGKDPELRYTPNGAAVATFSIATNESWTDKEGVKHDETEWHNIVVWNRLAEICGQYLTKGKKIYVEGKLRTRSWEDQNKNKRYTTEVIVREMQMLDSGSGERGEGSSYGPPPPQDPPPYIAKEGGSGSSTTEDDIPF